jgi:hypothetical protein
VPEHPAEIAELLNGHPEVRWDRCFEYLGTITVFGWVDRKCPDCDGRADVPHDPTQPCPTCDGEGLDRRADFVAFDIVPAENGDHGIAYTTSSAELSEEIGRRLGIPTHVPCQRVEEVFGALVPNAVRL